MPRYLDQLVLDEGVFSSEHYSGMQKDGKDAIVRFRRSPLLITAPHATKHGRFGSIKEEDEFTGSLALLLGRELDASVIAASRCNPDTTNAGELSTDFYAALTELAPQHRMVIDLHGMSDSHQVGICIGTGSRDPENESIAFAVQALLSEMTDFQAKVNQPFSAQASYTVTEIVNQEYGLPALQLELAKSFRTPSHANGKKHAAFIDALLNALRTISGELSV